MQVSTATGVLPWSPTVNKEARNALAADSAVVPRDPGAGVPGCGCARSFALPKLHIPFLAKTISEAVIASCAKVYTVVILMKLYDFHAKIVDQLRDAVEGAEKGASRASTGRNPKDVEKASPEWEAYEVFKHSLIREWKLVGLFHTLVICILYNLLSVLNATACIIGLTTIGTSFVGLVASGVYILYIGVFASGPGAPFYWTEVFAALKESRFSQLPMLLAVPIVLTAWNVILSSLVLFSYLLDHLSRTMESAPSGFLVGSWDLSVPSRIAMLLAAATALLYFVVNFVYLVAVKRVCSANSAFVCDDDDYVWDLRTISSANSSMSSLQSFSEDEDALASSAAVSPPANAAIAPAESPIALPNPEPCASSSTECT